MLRNDMLMFVISIRTSMTEMQAPFKYMDCHHVNKLRLGPAVHRDDGAFSLENYS